MIYTYIKYNDKLLAGVTAMFLREKRYDKYRKANFQILDEPTGYKVILYNEDEDFNDPNFFDDAEYINIDENIVLHEIKRCKYIVENIIEYLGGEIYGNILLSEYGLSLEEYEVIDNFNQMGGMRITKGNTILEIKLNYMDLFDVLLVKDGKTLVDSKNLYFDQLYELLV